MEFTRNILLGVFIILVWKFCTAKIDHKLDDKFELFKIKFSRKYQNSTEELKRKLQFIKTDQKIIKHNQERNKGKLLYNMSHNQFSDRFENEINEMSMNVDYKIHKSNNRNRRQLPAPTTVPDSFNWLEKGWNTPVQYQGDCSSCYAFSAVGTIEAAHFIKTGEYIKLSEQDVIDCSYQFNTKGCKGGYLHDVFNYVAYFGLSLEQYYPYKADQKIYCLKSGNQTYIRKYELVQQGNERALKHAVAINGPVAVTISATAYFLHYSQGIYYDPYCDQQLFYHNIIIVGYGTEEGFDYWLAKNSWGTAWGIQGYIKIIRNSNICGIANYAVFPIL